MIVEKGNALTITSLHSTAYCWGNFAGPFVVKDSEAPNYPSATIGLLVGYTIKTGCHLALLGIYSDKHPFLGLCLGADCATAYLFTTNRHRDRTYGPANKEKSNEAGMQDKTEFQNKDFRYVL
jgi:hypothetical protein